MHAAGLGGIDLAVLGAYLLGVVGLSFYFARRQRSGVDYFLAGRSMTGLPLALSVLANQASAVSLVGAPAFVALHEGGGLRWLQYELGLPLAMVALVALLLPALRSVPGSSIYRYADARFGPGTRRLLAGAFLLTRGLSLGVILYASALVVSQALGWPVERSLVAVGLFSVAYTSLGGIVADIWSDVIQLALLWGGTLLASLHLLWTHGRVLLQDMSADRARTLVFDAHGLGDGATFAFWPMLLGGVFLYMSYYGCDQSQAQRLLTARNDGAARRALVLNGLLRFPLVLTYCAFGLLLLGLLQTDPSFAALMEGRRPDSLVPVFLAAWLPEGLRGLLLAAILAAAMSSIDSALNSLAAITLEDVLDRPPERQGVWLGRATALLWGLFAVVSGIAFARGEAGVLEGINQIGSAFYGPVLAVFLLGVLAPGVRGREATAGLVAGVVGNVLLWRLAPGLSWLWWNPIGLTVAALVALILGRTLPRLPSMDWPQPATPLLLAASVGMLAALVLLPALLV
jgi:SSS family solute:Na+ symporter